MQAKKYVIKKKKSGIGKWAEDDRPREKLLRKSPQSLSNAELLAIILNEGVQGKSAVDLARELLRLTGDNLSELSRIPLAEFRRIKGIGLAKAVKLAACFELNRRQSGHLPRRIPKMDASSKVADYLKSHFSHFSHEIFAVLFLNNANYVKDFSVISTGGITSTTVDIRLILKKALEVGATKFILGHNHPSGNLLPSEADKLLTSRIQVGAEALDMKVLDHLIVSTEGYFSFADAGIL